MEILPLRYWCETKLAGN